jgi:hypothetical protein
VGGRGEEVGCKGTFAELVGRIESRIGGDLTDERHLYGMSAREEGQRTVGREEKNWNGQGRKTKGG